MATIDALLSVVVSFNVFMDFTCCMTALYRATFGVIDDDDYSQILLFFLVGRNKHQLQQLRSLHLLPLSRRPHRSLRWQPNHRKVGKPRSRNRPPPLLLHRRWLVILSGRLYLVLFAFIHTVMNTFIRQKTDGEVKHSIKVRKQNKKERNTVTVKSADTVVIKSSTAGPRLMAAERIDFKLAVLVYKCQHGAAPSYLADELRQPADCDALITIADCPPYTAVNHRQSSFPGRRCPCLERFAAPRHVGTITGCLPQ